MTVSQFDDGVPHTAACSTTGLAGYNGPTDRAAADDCRSQGPGVAATARQSWRFLIRVARLLAREAGMRQLLDIGAGFPLDPGQRRVGARL